jgi:hypothetical protein
VRSRYRRLTNFDNSATAGSSKALFDRDNCVRVLSLLIFLAHSPVSLLARKSKYLISLSLYNIYVPLSVIWLLFRNNLVRLVRFSQISVTPTSVILLSPRINVFNLRDCVNSLTSASVMDSLAKSSSYNELSITLSPMVTVFPINCPDYSDIFNRFISSSTDSLSFLLESLAAFSYADILLSDCSSLSWFSFN